jgi:hypothetical protein
MGMPVVRDDNLTVDTVPAVPASGEDPAKPGYKVYYSYLFGAGAFAFGLGSPKTPFEIDRIVLAGHGGGQDIIVSRQSMVLHPNGYKCKLTSTPTDAQLKSALSWERSWDRKRIPLAVIKSRG